MPFITTLELTTALEAVNAILRSVGEAPVVSLDDQFVDAGSAASLLVEELRAVQTVGWTFNTDLDVVLTPDVNDNIAIPANTLKFVYTDDANIVVRGTSLYDRSTQTYEFDDAITATRMVMFLDWEDCPEPMRRFATIRAGRKLQDVYESDQAIHGFQEKDEMNAWIALINHESDTANWNMLDNDLMIQRIRSNRPS